MIETDTDSDVLSVFELIRNDYGQKNEILSIKPLNESRIIHKLSHQHLHIRFFKAEVRGILDNAISYESMISYPFPIVIYNFIEKKMF